MPSARPLAVRHPYDGSLVATVPTSGEHEVAATIAAARRAAGPLRTLPAAARADALAHVAARLLQRRDEVAELITAESGKPLRWARVEAERAAATFRWAAEEARRWDGEVQRLDGDVAGLGRLALVRRFPIGPVLAITPFNFPVNLVAHKLAPALAVGAPVVVKPSPRTPLGARLLAELLAETDLPAGSVGVLVLPDGPEAMALVGDPALPVVSFTGSALGWRVRAAAPRKHVLLELGGSAAVVVCADAADPEDGAALAEIAGRIARGAYAQAGQSCIAVQRILVHASLAAPLTEALVAATEALGTGDPRAEGTEVGPVIDATAADRISSWVADAVAGGARLLTGGPGVGDVQRDGTTVAPALLADVPTDRPVWADEVFGPVAAVRTFHTEEEAFALVNDSAYGLQAGIFTRDLRVAVRAQRDLVVGGVVVGDVPTFRSDRMPYGGWKGSGIGREGARSAMLDLTAERTLVLSGLDL